MTASAAKTRVHEAGQVDWVGATRAKTLRMLGDMLDLLEDGPSLYASMLDIDDPNWGTKVGHQYSLQIVEDDETYRTVLSWWVKADGSVDPVRVGKERSQQFQTRP